MSGARTAQNPGPVSGLDAIEWEAPLLEPIDNPASEREARKIMTFIPSGIRYYFDSAWVTRSMAHLSVTDLPLRHVTAELCELIALVVSQDNSCRYCYEATRDGLMILGFPEERILRLQEDLLSADLSPREQRSLELARRISRATPVASAPDAAALLATGAEVDAVREVAFLAAVNVFFNRVTTIPAIPPTRMSEPGWLEQARRALGAGLVWPRHRGERTALSADERAGPYADVVAALDGLPAARRLRIALDATFGATSLGARARALVFAVVARGLGCAAASGEAERLLLNEGMTAEEIAHVLAHLSGPMLDPLEQAAVALARESIWYRPAQIQRHARTIRPLFSREQFVDLLGYVAVANMVGRLGIVTDLDAVSA